VNHPTVSALHQGSYFTEFDPGPYPTAKQKDGDGQETDDSAPPGLNCGMAVTDDHFPATYVVAYVSRGPWPTAAQKDNVAHDTWYTSPISRPVDHVRPSYA
jgi:hypothetical protein